METLLTNEQIADAVYWRICERNAWTWIADELGVTRKTVYNARQTDRWVEVALEVIKEIKAEAFPVAWQGLLNAAEKDDVAACREILNRVDEVIPDRLIIEDYSDLPADRLAEIADTDGDYRTASEDGADTEGAGNGGD